MYATRRRVAVIGAGPSGLVATKELLEQGHKVLAFEQQPMLGGVCAIHYVELRLHSSNLPTSFGDHPSQEGKPHVWSCAEYLAYLYSYAARFELFPHINCSTQVTSVRRDADTGTWRVRIRYAPADPETPRHPVPSAYIMENLQEASTRWVKCTLLVGGLRLLVRDHQD